MQVAYRVFRSSFSSCDTLFEEAAEFATQLGPGRVISISHSEDKNDGVVTVWYWRVGPPQTSEATAAAEVGIGVEG